MMIYGEQMCEHQIRVVFIFALAKSCSSVAGSPSMEESVYSYDVPILLLLHGVHILYNESILFLNSNYIPTFDFSIVLHWIKWRRESGYCAYE